MDIKLVGRGEKMVWKMLISFYYEINCYPSNLNVMVSHFSRHDDRFKLLDKLRSMLDDYSIDGIYLNHREIFVDGYDLSVVLSVDNGFGDKPDVDKFYELKDVIDSWAEGYFRGYGIEIVDYTDKIGIDLVETKETGLLYKRS